MKSMKFDPLKMAVTTGFGQRIDKRCPRCGHDTLLMPGANIRLTDEGFDTAMPVACCYPGCGYSTDDTRISRRKLHNKHVFEMKRDKALNYFNNFSVTADDDDLSKSFDSFKAPTPELQKAKAIAEHTAKNIADGKICHSFLLGDTGIGKTHLAYAIINSIWNDTDYQKKIIFLNMFQLSLIHNKSIHDMNTRKWFDQLLFQISSADLIVIDDLGREQNNVWNKSIMAVVANERENKSILITSNIDAFKRYSSQTLDRLKEHTKGYVMRFTNTNSYRTGNE